LKGPAYDLFSKLSLKRVKREHIEEEAGSHRGLCATVFSHPRDGFAAGAFTGTNRGSRALPKDCECFELKILAALTAVPPH
jgi:hypothetical protein